MLDFLIYNNRDELQQKILLSLNKIRYVATRSGPSFTESCNDFISIWLTKDSKNNIIFINEPKFTSLAGPLDLEIYCKNYDYICEDNFLLLSNRLIKKLKSITNLDRDLIVGFGFNAKPNLFH